MSVTPASPEAAAITGESRRHGGFSGPCLWTTRVCVCHSHGPSYHRIHHHTDATVTDATGTDATGGAFTQTDERKAGRMICWAVGRARTRPCASLAIRRAVLADNESRKLLARSHGSRISQVDLDSRTMLARAHGFRVRAQASAHTKTVTVPARVTRPLALRLKQEEDPRISHRISRRKTPC